ncbi:hypothetical protein DCAR_0831518 [Daucus carota subsp. sativus]|uniref:Uncharacterized protein n=1 Tax=Daucus carota subsp. sativus TaxID=79200 RepID=A0A175YNG3_DAUCS|nr:hypothetical protein DCAR_0831518 [Daucus carota subsp. sativus]
MESLKLASVLTIVLMVLVACSSVGFTAALEDVGAPAPSPTIESSSVTLLVPAALVAITSLVTFFV